MDDLQAKLSQAKCEYKTALKNLEMISDEIHQRRRSSAMGPRGRGVGAEGAEGDGVSGDDGVAGDDITNFKMESDGISSEYKERMRVARHLQELSGELLHNMSHCILGFPSKIY